MRFLPSGVFVSVVCLLCVSVCWTVCMCVCVAVCVCTRQTDRIRVGARSTALSNQSCIVVYDCKESGVRGSAARGWIVGAVGLVRLAWDCLY